MEGYKEEESTTTPFDVMMANKVSRYEVASRAIRAAREIVASDEKLKNSSSQILGRIVVRMTEVKCYIQENGKGKSGSSKS